MGVLFHMAGTLSQFGKVGLTAIGNSPEQAEAIESGVIEVLDRETRR
jgi:PGM1 C-terminal domain